MSSGSATARRRGHGSCATSVRSLLVVSRSHRELGNRLLLSASRRSPPPVAPALEDGRHEPRDGRFSSFERGSMTRVGLVPGAILFQAWDPEHGSELWRSDGTSAGDPARQGHPQHRRRRLVAAQVPGGRQRGVFLADAPDATGGLWRSDGTAAGTRPVESPPECPRIVELVTVLAAGIALPSRLCPSPPSNRILILTAGDRRASAPIPLAATGRRWKTSSGPWTEVMEFPVGLREGEPAFLVSVGEVSRIRLRASGARTERPRGPA